MAAGERGGGAGLGLDLVVPPGDEAHRHGRVAAPRDEGAQIMAPPVPGQLHRPQVQGGAARDGLHGLAVVGGRVAAVGGLQDGDVLAGHDRLQGLGGAAVAGEVVLGLVVGDLRAAADDPQRGAGGAAQGGGVDPLALADPADEPDREALDAVLDDAEQPPHVRVQGRAQRPGGQQLPGGLGGDGARPGGHDPVAPGERRQLAVADGAGGAAVVAQARPRPGAPTARRCCW
ncbi:hypothetical protein GCM10020218_002330 [Dactylosporangium vinaceum]